MSNRKLKKAVISIVIIAAAAVYLFYLAAGSGWAYYYTVDEFVEQNLDKMTQDDGAADFKMNNLRPVRLAGWVSDGTVVYDAGKMELEFELAGEKEKILVSYYGRLPDNFAAGREVLVEGTALAEGVFEADKILTRCESKYKVRLQGQR